MRNQNVDSGKNALIAGAALGVFGLAGVVGGHIANEAHIDATDTYALANHVSKTCTDAVRVDKSYTRPSVSSTDACEAIDPTVYGQLDTSVTYETTSHGITALGVAGFIIGGMTVGTNIYRRMRNR